MTWVYEGEGPEMIMVTVVDKNAAQSVSERKLLCNDAVRDDTKTLGKRTHAVQRRKRQCS